MKTTTDLTNGNIKKQILLLSLPLIAGNLLQQMYNAIDAFVISRFADESDFAAIGVSSATINFLLFALMGACNGVAVMFSRLHGAKREEEFRSCHFSALVFGFTLTMLLMILFYVCLPLWLRITQTPPEIIIHTAAYLHIVLLGLPFAYLYNFYSALLRSTGRTKSTLYILFFSVAVNLVLDLFLVVGCKKGIIGAAVATVIS